MRLAAVLHGVCHPDHHGPPGDPAANRTARYRRGLKEAAPDRPDLQRPLHRTRARSVGRDLSAPEASGDVPGTQRW